MATETKKIQNKFRLGGTTYEFDVDSAPSAGVEKPVSSGGVAAALAGFAGMEGCNVTDKVTNSYKHVPVSAAVYSFVRDVEESLKAYFSSLLASKAEYRVFTDKAAMNAATASNGTIGYNQADEQFYIYDLANAKWRQVALDMTAGGLEEEEEVEDEE